MGRKTVKVNRTALSDNKGTGKSGKASVGATALPTIAGIAFQLPADDLVVQTFEEIGIKKCLKCFKKVQTESMVLCMCGHYICRDCFLAGCFCTDKSGDARKGKGKKKDSAYYIPVASTSEMVNLEGQEFELECIFSNPVQM